MLINFALDFLGTTVTCDKVSSDGHECTNLINTNYMTRKQGYIAEPFIKPPVNITFAFPCSINISHIVLDPYVGRQQCLLIDMLCATKPRPRTLHGKMRQEANLINSNQSSSSNEVPLRAFFPVSKINCRTKSPICFYSSHFNHNHRCSSTSKNPLDYEVRSEMRNYRKELLTCASHITVRIARTQDGSTPAIANVEIWGNVSFFVAHEVRKSLEEKYIRFVTPTIVAPSTSSTIQNGNKELLCDDSHKNDQSQSGRKKNGISVERSNDIDIPEEFLDPLTFEVMTIPMLLPCGKNIDKSSLDRFSESEACHGRQPRDPFTGVEFSAVARPIPNIDLKARIDNFLISHANVKSLATIPRTVSKGLSSGLLGKRKLDDCTKFHNVSSLVAGSASSLHAAKFLKNVDRKGNYSATGSVENASGERIGQKSSPIVNRSCIQDLPSTSVSASKSDNQSTTKSGNEVHEAPKSHEDRLRDSLDSALFSILGSISSGKAKVQSASSSDSGSSNSNNNSNTCLNCDIAVGPESTVYSTPCSHLICRKCLVSFKGPDIQCSKCGRNFQKMSVVRTH